MNDWLNKQLDFPIVVFVYDLLLIVLVIQVVSFNAAHCLAIWSCIVSLLLSSLSMMPFGILKNFLNSGDL